MRKIIDKFYLSGYKEDDNVLYTQAFSLVSILLGLTGIFILLSVIIEGEKTPTYMVIMSFLTLSITFLVKMNKMNVARSITITFLSIACSMLILTMNIASYVDVYFIAFLQMFVLVITLLVTEKPKEPAIVMVLGSLAIIFNHFFRALPANLNDKAPTIDDPIIAMILIIFSGIIVISSNKRGRNLVESISKESSLNLERTKHLHTIVGKLQGDFDTGEELMESSNKMSSAVTEVKDMILSIKQEVAILSESTGVLQQSSSSIAESSEVVSKSSETQTVVIEQTSAAIEEMASSINNIAKIAEDRKLIVTKLSVNAERAEEVLSESTSAMENLQGLIQSLGEVNSVISNIASQTSLLAMNAAIEAAHAGDAGKGFAVVADEIRKLSENSGNNVKTISDMLKKISEAINSATDINSTATNSFHQIREEIKNVVSGMDEILSGVTELSAGTQDINNGNAQSVSSTSEVRSGIRDVNDQIQQISHSMVQQLKSSELVLESIGHTQEKMLILEEESSIVKDVGEQSVLNLKKLGQELEK
ncbi:MAG: methyl-accepting chemotaxis protein [Spirochaetaceae bacterium]